MFGLLAALLPPVFGAPVRGGVDAALAALNASSLPVHIETLQRHKGWFRSEYRLRVVGLEDTVPVQLSIIHGPVFWHLLATPLGFADLQLQPDPDAAADARRHLSASALLSLRSPTRLSLRGIAGFSALGGEHWLEARMSWRWGTRPFLQAQQNGEWPTHAKLDLWMDADAQALANSDYASLLEQLRADGRVRVSAGRALGHVMQTEIR